MNNEEMIVWLNGLSDKLDKQISELMLLLETVRAVKAALIKN